MRSPFQKPDAFEGGARTRAEALARAQSVAGHELTVIEATWARAWANILVGQEPWPKTSTPQEGGPRRPGSMQDPGDQPSIWQTLGLHSQASVLEIKRAYRQRALVTHPDRGGTDIEFRALHAAYLAALKRRKLRPKAP